MSKNDREAGGIVTDFAKFSDTQLKKVAIVLSKSQGSFLPKQVLIKHGKDTFGSNYMENTVTVKRKILPKSMNNVILRTSSRLTVSSLCSSMMPSTPKDPSSPKQPSCKVCSMTLWSRRFSKAHLLVMRTTGANKFDLSLSSLS
jgi:hypothetical protein